ncbi:hypothetical protein F3N42_13970 [Marinihelvus fidelis]|uniref:Uncharacterized protein n=1 Tax=Marinihelvus fidelis TaxID=2613842 RepID=A0A5N0T4P6_9GAMM|nr:hypothetical protein [Marinihelvus fidelis]KAA9129883.1 hypothetical protein F3N42_13970 [Marinihelvus fidelis]
MNRPARQPTRRAARPRAIALLAAAPRFAASVAAAMLLHGCAYITAEAPVGEQPVHLATEDLAGAWHGDNVTVTFEPVNVAEGRYRALWTEDGQQKSLELLLRAHRPAPGSGGQPWRMWNVKVADFQASEGTAPDLDQANSTDGERHDHYYWGRFRLEGDRLIAWGPSASRLAPLVEAGALPGELVEDNVRLGTLTTEHLDIITGNDHGVLLDWEYPLVLYRIIHD